MKPGDEHVHRGILWQVERVELRSNGEHWAKLVRTVGLGKTARLVDIAWIRTDEGGKENE